jgi:hypothetical protein
MNLTDIEGAVLHEVVEDYEASGMNLYLLIDFIHHYFAPPDSTIADTYQLALDTLKSLENKGLIQLVQQIFQRLDDGSNQVINEDVVPESLVPQILRDPRTWRNERCHDWIYLYIPTDVGAKMR